MNDSNTKDITSPALRRDLDKLGKEISAMLNDDFTGFVNTDKEVILYWDNQTGAISIEGEDGTIDEAQARSVWMSGNVKDCNVAFNRLVAHDFDVAKALASYDW